MSKVEKRVTRGRLAGRKITFASTGRIEEFGQPATGFMGQAFDCLPDEYLNYPTQKFAVTPNSTR